MNTRKTINKVPVSNMKKMGNSLDNTQPTNQNEIRSAKAGHPDSSVNQETESRCASSDLRPGFNSPQESPISPNGQLKAERRIEPKRLLEGGSAANPAPVDILTKKKQDLQKEIDELNKEVDDCINKDAFNEGYNILIKIHILKAELKGITETEDVLRKEYYQNHISRRACYQEGYEQATQKHEEFVKKLKDNLCGCNKSGNCDHICPVIDQTNKEVMG